MDAAGTDALASNLTAVIAYYIDIIVGLDYDSFSARGGDIYFQKAQNIVNNAPDGRNISGCWIRYELSEVVPALAVPTTINCGFLIH